MNEVLLARWQFGITSTYHFLFVPLTLGLSVLVAIMETVYVRTGNEIYKKMAQFWGKLFVINFILGVVTGIVQEFHFGMNWSEYSRFVGDIFGVPLAIEALAAFFLESVFLGLWIFGWNRLSKGLHAASIWIVALAGNLSAYWILVANSFMQEPVGYAIRNGRAEMTDFWALLTNPHVLYQFPHVITGGFCTAAFFVMGVSAYHLLRKNQRDFFIKSFRMALVMGLAGVLLVNTIGHFQGQHLVKSQPMKMAAAEALWESADPAPLAAFAIIDEENRTNTFEVEIPYLLSFLSYNTFSGEVKGLNDLQAQYEAVYGPGNYIPPVTPLFWSFRIMVGMGTLMTLLALLGLYLVWKGRLDTNPLYLKIMLLAIPLPYIANTSGWFLAEVGRQPWIVFGLQRVQDAISPSVSAGTIVLSLVGFTLLYGVLALADLYLLIKYAARGPVETRTDTGVGVAKEVSLWT